MSSPSPARVKYKIVKCTSEDPEYPVSELLAHSSQTKGWQTARFCDFPQEIGLQFETPVHLRQVQFLSHQSKIATKIELFTAPPSEGANSRYESAQFKRLGYLSLDNNERSQFQARELKSVYVDVSAQFLRIVFHKCHVNRYNIVNQVGLIALHCSGEVLGTDLAVGPPPPKPNYSRNSLPGTGPADQPAVASAPAQPPRAAAREPPAYVPAPAPTVVEQPRQPERAPAAQAPQAAQAAQDVARTGADETKYDARTNERIKELTSAKQRAVEAEDYEEAKRCKEMLQRLQETGQRLKELEGLKLAAVQNEDFDTATQLKVEIDRLRSSAERSPSHSSSRDSANARPPSAGQAWPVDGGKPAERAPPPQQMTAQRGGHQPVMAQGLGYDSNGGAGASQRPGSQGRLSAAMPESAPYGGDGDAAYGSDVGGARGMRSGGASPTFNPSYDEPSSRGPNPPGAFDGGFGGGAGMHGRAALGGEETEGPGGSLGGADRERSSPSEAAHHLRGVPNVDDLLASPEPLSAFLEKDKECMLLVQLFGDYITRCIFSKTWNLRDAALQKLAIDLRDGAQSGSDPDQLLQGYVAILKRTIADKNVQVSLSSGGLLQAVAQVLLQSGRIRRNEAQASLDPIMPLLVERLGEANARVDKTARDALLDFARCQHIGALFTTQYLLRSPKKKTGAAVHARVFSSRLQLLTALASDFGVQPESRDGVPLESTVKLAMEWFNNKDGEVRENSVKLVAACYEHVGLQRIEGYLANLRPAQREVFDAEFDRVSGAPHGQGAAGRMQPAARDDGYGDTYQIPPPALAPARRGGEGSGAPASGGYMQEEAPYAEQEVEDFTCQFCGRHDPYFTSEALDVHYWRECPMLIQCEFCQQVIEICTLRSHLCEECESGAAAHAVGRDMLPSQCPLCRTNVGGQTDQDWRDHLLSAGCPGNPRSNMRSGSSRGQR